MRAPRYVGNNFPFAAREALTGVAVHQYGLQHLTRGGPAGRARAATARGATPVVAAAGATPTFRLERRSRERQTPALRHAYSFTPGSRLHRPRGDARRSLVHIRVGPSRVRVDRRAA